MDYITQNQWLAVSKDTRAKLRQIFFVPSTGMVEVVTDEFGKATVKQDGHTNVDLQVITVEKLLDFVGTAAVNETIFDLWKRAVDKVENPEVLKVKVEVEAKDWVGVVGSNGEAKTMNTADNPLKCNFCGYTTGSKHGINIHKARKHNRVKVA